MHQFLAKWETKAVEEDAQHLEVVFLLVAHHIHHLVDRVVLETKFGGTYVLGHIYGCAVGTEKEFLIEPVLCEVSPYTTILAAVEVAFGEAAFYFAFAYEIGVAFVVNLIEAHTHLLVGLIKACIHPFVHLLPQRTYLWVVLLPFHEHSLCLLDEWGLFLGCLLIYALCHKLFDLSLVLLVKTDIVVADEVVAFLATILRCLAIAEHLPCEHRFADMNTAIVHDIGLDYVPSVGLLNLSDGVTKQVVAHMSEVQRLVGIG